MKSVGNQAAEQHRKRLWTETIYPFRHVLFLLAVGAILFIMGDRYSDEITFEGNIPATKANYHLVLFQTTRWQVTLLQGVAMAILTISVFELIKLLFQTYFMVRHQKPFEQFFGQSYSASSGGQIIIQADKISVVMKHFLPDLERQLEETPKNRLHKARTWVNKNDMEGAKRIREAFNSAHFRPPNINTVDRSPMSRSLEGPFIISMGLAYTQMSLDMVPSSAIGSESH